MGPQLTIRNALTADLEDVHSVHHGNAGEYLWPRPADALAELIEDRALFIARDQDGIRGICYTVLDGGRSEFGGLFVDEALRGRGVAAALGRVAISSLYLADAPKLLIAHVHEFNELPRRVLSGQLGFEETGEQETAPDAAPPTMRRNAEGRVVGDLFRFQRQSLTTFADWLMSFDGSLGQDELRVDAALDLDLWRRRDELAPALRETARTRA